MGSHNILIEYINKDKNIKYKNVIEIGTTREITSQLDSSSKFYLLSKDKQFNFITVDMDPENTKNIKSRYPDINALCCKGEDFLQKYPDTVDYLYLDAFDFYHNGHSKERQESYRKNLGCEIATDDKLCHQMHLECCQNVIDKMPSKSIIVIDDVIDDKRGKGVTAIPFLLSNGFSLIQSNFTFQKD